jgi:hypothetical protein
MISTWLAASYADGSGSAAGRIALVAVAVLAVGAYVFLQLKARSAPGQGRTSPVRPVGLADVSPPGPGPSARDAGEPHGNEESSRPDWRYGYPPGYEPYPLYDQARSPWTARGPGGPATGGPEPRPGTRRAPGGEAAFPSQVWPA